MRSYDAIVIGAGVIGSSVAYHLARLGCKRVLVLDRNQVGAGNTSQSSGILRTHYSVVQNVEMAKASWEVFKNFAAYLGDDKQQLSFKYQQGERVNSSGRIVLGALA